MVKTEPRRRRKEETLESLFESDLSQKLRARYHIPDTMNGAYEAGPCGYSTELMLPRARHSL